MKPDMESEFTKHFRIILRQRKNQLYLQPSGQWSAERQTAREFVTSVTAYWWALEHKLLGVDVVMAFGDERYDLVTMKV